MTFRTARLDSPACGSRCPEVIVADGVIEENTPQAFVDFARQAAYSPHLRSIVLLNSPGGNVVASMELGSAFRELHVGGHRRRLRLGGAADRERSLGDASRPASTR